MNFYQSFYNLLYLRFWLKNDKSLPHKFLNNQVITCRMIIMFEKKAHGTSTLLGEYYIHCYSINIFKAN